MSSPSGPVAFTPSTELVSALPLGSSPLLRILFALETSSLSGLSVRKPRSLAIPGASWFDPFHYKIHELVLIILDANRHETLSLKQFLSKREAFLLL